MPLKYVTDNKRLQTTLIQMGNRAEKGMSARMRERARLIRDLAREYAPRDTGQLEKSIDYVTLRGPDGRNQYMIYVDTSEVYTRPNGKTRGTIGGYARIMHTRLRPYGNVGKRLNLGPRSRLKGGKVGGRYMTRAVKDGLEGFRDELGRAVRSSIRSS